MGRRSALLNGPFNHPTRYRQCSEHRSQDFPSFEKHSINLACRWFTNESRDISGSINFLRGMLTWYGRGSQSVAVAVDEGRDSYRGCMLGITRYRARRARAMEILMWHAGATINSRAQGLEVMVLLNGGVKVYI